MSRFLKKEMEALVAYTPGEQPRDMQYIKLNTNESPFPPAPGVLEAIKREDIEKLRLYSDPTCKELKEKLASLYGVKPENLFIGNGSDEILNFAFMAYSQEHGVTFPDISYGFYSVYADLYCADARQVPLKDDFSLCYKDYCNSGTMVVIANPNAPTGLVIGLSQIEEILKTNPDTVVVIDEAYIDFGGESCYKLIEKYENLLVVRTYSKSRCLAGGRLGYAFGSATLISDLEKLRYSTNPYNIDRLTLLLGEKTVDENEYYMEKCREIIRVRELTALKLQEMGFSVLPSSTNFLFVKNPAIDGNKLYLSLKARGILVRHFGNPRISDFVRITIGTEKQMDIFIRTVKSILEEL